MRSDFKQLVSAQSAGSKNYTAIKFELYRINQCLLNVYLIRDKPTKIKKKDQSSINNYYSYTFSSHLLLQ